MIGSDITQEILQRLASAEQEHQIKILYACESGSRAWGFASADSDYDVRFIYSRPRDWYLSFDVESRRDVIEYPIVDEIDCNGWDLRKALYLFSRTNGALLEWLRSPIVYSEFGSLRSALLALAPQAANRTALCYHYSHMARGNARGYLFHEDNVKLKKYFYVLRPLLAIRYIEATNQPPPTEFEQLVERVAPDAIRPDVARLLKLKRQSTELGLGKPIQVINEFIASELSRHGEAFKGQGRPDLQTGQVSRDELNRIFRTVIAETNMKETNL